MLELTLRKVQKRGLGSQRKTALRTSSLKRHVVCPVVDYLNHAPSRSYLLGLLGCGFMSSQLWCGHLLHWFAIHVGLRVKLVACLLFQGPPPPRVVVFKSNQKENHHFGVPQKRYPQNGHVL